MYFSMKNDCQIKQSVIMQFEDFHKMCSAYQWYNTLLGNKQADNKLETSLKLTLIDRFCSLFYVYVILNRC
jgi:hypothetical protein